MSLTNWKPSYQEGTSLTQFTPEPKKASSLTNWSPSSLQDTGVQQDTRAAEQAGEFAPRVQRVIDPDLKGFYGEQRTESVLQNLGLELEEMKDAYVTLGSMLMDNPVDTIIEVGKALPDAMVESYSRWVDAAKEGRFIEALEKYPLQAVQDLTLPLSILAGGSGAVLKAGGMAPKLTQALAKTAQISNIAGVISDPIGGAIGYGGQKVVGKAFRKLTGQVDEATGAVADAAERTALEQTIERRLIDDLKMPADEAGQVLDDLKADPNKFLDDTEIQNVISRANEDLNVSKIDLNPDGTLPDNVIDDISDVITGTADEVQTGIKTSHLTDLVNNTDDLTKIVDNVARKYEDTLEKFTRGVISQEESDRVARMMIDSGFSENDILKLKPGDTGNAAKILAVHKVEGDLRLNMSSNSRIAGELPSDVNLAKFQKSMDIWRPVYLRKMGLRAESGRSLNIWNKIGKMDTVNAKTLADMVDSVNGGKKRIQDIASEMARMNADQVAGFADTATKAKGWDKFREAWYASLLSGLTTQIVNMGSNAGVLMYAQGLENIAASGVGYTRIAGRKAIKALSGGKIDIGGNKLDHISVAENIGRIKGMGRGFTTAAREAFKTFMTGEISDFMTPMADAGRREAIGGKLGYVIRTPLRALEAGDTFFKMMNYSSELEGLAARQAMELVQAGKLAKNQIRDHISDVLANAEKKYPALNNKAHDVARYNTFTNQLGGDAFTEFGKIIQEARANKYVGKPLQLIIPFVRTPANIMKFAVERTPLAVLLKDTRDAILAGGVARDRALARIGMGTALGWFAADLAMKDKDLFGNNISITGGLSTDRSERDMQYQDFQPYSIKINDKYYSYARFEPLGSIVGLAADFIGLNKKMNSQHWKENEKEMEKVPAMIAASFAKNLTSKTYLRGLAEGMKAFDDPDRYFSQFIGNLGSTVVPTAVAQYTRSEDPFLRDAHSIMEKIRAKVPGASETLPARVNIWGEEIKRETPYGFINPIYMMTDKKDKVTDELIRLNTFPGMPSRVLAGIKLTPKQYKTYATMSGKAIKEQLDIYINDPSWDNQSIPDQKDLIWKVFRIYRRNAKNVMLRRDKALKQEYLRRRQLEQGG